jgi:hypothetical protein
MACTWNPPLYPGWNGLLHRVATLSQSGQRESAPPLQTSLISRFPSSDILSLFLLFVAFYRFQSWITYEASLISYGPLPDEIGTIRPHLIGATPHRLRPQRKWVRPERARLGM